MDEILVKYKADITDLQNSLKRVEEQFKTVDGKGFEKIEESARRAGKSIDGVDAHLKKTGDSTKKVNEQLTPMPNVLGNIRGMVVAAFSVNALVGFYNKLSELEDQMDAVYQKAQILFRDEFGKIEEQANRTATAMGMSNMEFINAVSSTTLLVENLGFTRNEAKGMADQLIKVASNLQMVDTQGRSTAQIAEQLTMAMAGQTKSLREFGIVSKVTTDELNLLEGGTVSQATAQSILNDIIAQTNMLMDDYGESVIAEEKRARQMEAELRNYEERMAGYTDAWKKGWLRAKVNFLDTFADAYNLMLDKEYLVKQGRQEVIDSMNAEDEKRMSVIQTIEAQGDAAIRMRDLLIESGTAARDYVLTETAREGIYKNIAVRLQELGGLSEQGKKQLDRTNQLYTVHNLTLAEYLQQINAIFYAEKKLNAERQAAGPTLGLIEAAEMKLNAARQKMKKATTEGDLAAARDEVKKWQKELDRLNGVQLRTTAKTTEKIKDDWSMIDVLISGILYKQQKAAEQQPDLSFLRPKIDENDAFNQETEKLAEQWMNAEQARIEFADNMEQWLFERNEERRQIWQSSYVDMYNVITDAFLAYNQTLGASSEQMFILEQITAIGRVVFETAMGIAAAKRALAQVPLVIPGTAVPNPSYPVAVATTAAQIADLKTTRAAQIATIIAQAVPKFIAISKSNAYADGISYVDGPGTTTSDSIPSWLSKGERVTKASTNAEYWNELEAIHNGTFEQYIQQKYILPALKNAILEREQRRFGMIGDGLARTMTSGGGWKGHNIEEMLKYTSNKRSKEHHELISVIKTSTRINNRKF